MKRDREKKSKGWGRLRRKNNKQVLTNEEVARIRNEVISEIALLGPVPRPPSVSSDLKSRMVAEQTNLEKNAVSKEDLNRVRDELQTNLEKKAIPKVELKRVRAELRTNLDKKAVSKEDLRRVRAELKTNLEKTAVSKEDLDRVRAELKAKMSTSRKAQRKKKSERAGCNMLPTPQVSIKDLSLVRDEIKSETLKPEEREQADRRGIAVPIQRTISNKDLSLIRTDLLANMSNTAFCQMDNTSSAPSSRNESNISLKRVGDESDSSKENSNHSRRDKAGKKHTAAPRVSEKDVNLVYNDLLAQLVVLQQQQGLKLKRTNGHATEHPAANTNGGAMHSHTTAITNHGQGPSGDDEILMALKVVERKLKDRNDEKSVQRVHELMNSLGES